MRSLSFNKYVIIVTIKLQFTMTIAARKAYNDGYNFNGPSL